MIQASRKLEILIITIGAIVSILSFANAADFSKKEVELFTPDGYRVYGEYYFISEKKGPTLLLLHILNGDHTDWESYLPLLGKAGVKSILAIDLRGHGGSNIHRISGQADSIEAVSWREFADDDFQNVLGNIEIAWDFLKECPSTDTSRIGIMGASIGANYAALFASKHPEVKSLALLSPGVVYRGIRCGKAVESYGRRAVLFAASEGDTYSAGSCAKLKSLSSGTPAHIEIYEEEAHGTRLLENNPKFEHFLSDWFLSTL